MQILDCQISWWCIYLSLSWSYLDLPLFLVVIVLRKHMFQFLFPGFSFLLISLYCLTGILLSCFWHIDKSFIVLNHYIWSIDFYFSVSFDCIVAENSSFFSFCYCFKQVFISFLYFRIIIPTTNITNSNYNNNLHKLTCSHRIFIFLSIEIITSNFQQLLRYIQRSTHGRSRDTTSFFMGFHFS